MSNNMNELVKFSDKMMLEETVKAIMNATNDELYDMERGSLFHIMGTSETNSYIKDIMQKLDKRYEIVTYVHDSLRGAKIHMMELNNEIDVVFVLRYYPTTEDIMTEESRSTILSLCDRKIPIISVLIPFPVDTSIFMHDIQHKEVIMA